VIAKSFRGEGRRRLRHEALSPPAMLDQPMDAAESRIVKTDPAFFSSYRTLCMPGARKAPRRESRKLGTGR
jgi:hypothetical protein